MSKRGQGCSSPTPESPPLSSPSTKRRRKRYWQSPSLSSSSCSSSSTSSQSDAPVQDVIEKVIGAEEEPFSEYENEGDEEVHGGEGLLDENANEGEPQSCLVQHEQGEAEENVVRNEVEGVPPKARPKPPPEFPPLPPHTSLPPFHHYRQETGNAPYTEWAGSYKVDELVEYHSKIHKEWLPAKVIHTGGGSMIMVNLKPGAWISKKLQAWKVRPRGHVASLTGLELLKLSKELNHVVRFKSPVIEDVKADLLSYKQPGELRFDSRIACSLMRHAVWVPKGRAEKVNSLIACICANTAPPENSASSQC